MKWHRCVNGYICDYLQTCPVNCLQNAMRLSFRLCSSYYFSRQHSLIVNNRIHPVLLQQAVGTEEAYAFIKYTNNNIFSRGSHSNLNRPRPTFIMPGNNKSFKLTDYDCIGFDLDNTLSEYKILATINLEYGGLAEYLVSEKKYNSEFLLKPIDDTSLDFLQRGLIIDFARGNLLKLDEHGAINKCSHGTKFLSDDEIVKIYGEQKRWEVTDEFCSNMLTTLNSGPESLRMRALLDYFDMPAALAFARIIDSLDFEFHTVSDYSYVWPDVLTALQNLYNRNNYANSTGCFFKSIKTNPHQFINKCDPALIQWLRQLKSSKLTFLVTGSNYDFASLTAQTSLGEDWESFFDVIVCFARKPGFFSGCRPFVELNGFEEMDPILGSDLKLGNVYSQGNWQDLYQLFARKLGKKDPKCLYFGDNVIQDVFTPSEYTKCDAVAVVEELKFKNHSHLKVDIDQIPESLYNSNVWGNYLSLAHNGNYLNTYWGGVLKKYSKICIPSLSYLAKNPVDHEYTND